MSLEDLKGWFLKNKEQVMKDYIHLLSIPSISTDPKYQEEVIQCAAFVEKHLQESGFVVEKIKTKGYPLIFGEKKGGKGPTILLYGHYDVQPVDPLEEWRSPPFEPRIEGNRIFARGAQDNKGQLMYVLASLRALKEFPGTVKILVEGEEEVGSESLSSSIPSLKEKLKTDYLLVVDVSIPELNTPAITLGCRGICTLSLELIGSKGDLHSGQHGGMAYNPLRALVQLLSQCWDEKGKVVVPHFYDEVEELSPDEKKGIDFLFSEEVYQKEQGMKGLWREEPYSPIESNLIRPTLEINGIRGGYAGEGFKTVIPAKAVAKISCRLVPDQDPHKIVRALEDFFKDKVPSAMTLKIHAHGAGFPVRAKPSPLTEIVQKAYEEVFQKRCLKILSGGSIPIVADLALALNADLLLMGLGHDSDQIHAPNESFGLDRLEKGFYVVGRVIETLR